MKMDFFDTLLAIGTFTDLPPWEKAVWQAAENYLHVGQKAYRVSYIKGSAVAVTSTRETSAILLMVAKIISYATVVLPLFALAIKALYRNKYSFSEEIEAVIISPPDPAAPSQDLICRLPPEIILDIFSYLACAELEVAAQASKEWRILARDSGSWQRVIAREIAVGEKQWAEYGTVGKSPALPLNIRDILLSPCPFWPQRKVFQTHLLLLVPQAVNGEPLHVQNLKEILTSCTTPKGLYLSRINEKQPQRWVAELPSCSADSSCWILGVLEPAGWSSCADSSDGSRPRCYSYGYFPSNKGLDRALESNKRERQQLMKSLCEKTNALFYLVAGDDVWNTTPWNCYMLLPPS